MNDPMENKIPAPIVAGDMNVHLSYIRRDLDELKNLQKSQHAENIAALTDLKNSSPTRAEHEALSLEYRDGHADHELRMRRLEMWGGLALGGAYVLNAILGYWLIIRK